MEYNSEIFNHFAEQITDIKPYAFESHKYVAEITNTIHGTKRYIPFGRGKYAEVFRDQIGNYKECNSLDRLRRCRIREKNIGDCGNAAFKLYCESRNHFTELILAIHFLW